MPLGPDDNEHLITFHPRPCFYFPNIDQIFFQPLENAGTQLTMRHLAATKPNRGFHLVAFLKPLPGVLHAIVVIVIVRTRPKLHFLDRDRYLFLLGLVCLLLGFVLKFSEVNNSANRRVGSGGYFNQVQAFFSGGANGISNIQYAELLTFLADDPDLRDANSLVNTGDRQAPVIRTLAATSKACSYTSPP